MHQAPNIAPPQPYQIDGHHEHGRGAADLRDPLAHGARHAAGAVRIHGELDIDSPQLGLVARRSRRYHENGPGCEWRQQQNYSANQANPMHARQGLGSSQATGETRGQNQDAQRGQGRAIHCYHVAMPRDHVLLQRRPFLARILVLALGALSAALLLGMAVWWWGTADCTTVIIIRHAEKALGSVADPPLTEAGEARAALLARMFGDTQSPGRVDAIYVTPALRNRLTAAPLAARLGLTPVVTSAGPKEL